jgi:hypothetical protein
VTAVAVGHFTEPLYCTLTVAPWRQLGVRAFTWCLVVVSSSPQLLLTEAVVMEQKVGEGVGCRHAPAKLVAIYWRVITSPPDRLALSFPAIALPHL